MRIADVEIGNTYLAKVSGALVRVIVVQRVEPTGFSKTVRFRVRRVDDIKVLTKTRTASALRPLPAPDPIAATLIEGAEAARALEGDGRWADAVAEWERVMEVAVANDRPRMAARAKTCAMAARAKIEAQHND